jgi:hypothetical protein
MDILTQWKQQRRWLDQLAEKKKAAENKANEVRADVMQEMFPEAEQYAAMEALFKETDTEIRRQIVAGEIQFDGAITERRKQVDVDVDVAVKWVMYMLLESVEDIYPEKIDIQDLKFYDWFTLTPQAVKKIEDAVKNRTYEVPADVAKFSEKVGAKLFVDKIMNPKAEE